MSDLGSSPISDKELEEIYDSLSKENLIKILIEKHHIIRGFQKNYRPTFDLLEEDYKTIEEEVYTYFVCLFGDEVITKNLYEYDKLNDYCKHHGYSKSFVLNAVRFKGKSQPF